jgi:hypothetical protein
LCLLTSDKDQAMRLRRIEIWLEDKQDTMVFVTNHLRLPSPSRRFTRTGTSENAVQTQIWTALIAMLALSATAQHLELGPVLLRQQLFVYRDLAKWLNDPFEPPEALQGAQLPLPLT